MARNDDYKDEIADAKEAIEDAHIPDVDDYVLGVDGRTFARQPRSYEPKRKTKWERIEDMLTPTGIAELKAGQVLVFEFEGSRTNLRIMRKTKDGKVWAQQIELHKPEDVEVVDAVK